MMNGFEGKDVVGSYFLSLWRWKSKNAAKMVNSDNDGEELEEIPKELDNPSEFAMLSGDKLTVCYRNERSQGHGVGLVRANCPAPVKRLLYYFEIRVVNAGARGEMGIGFTKSGGVPGVEAGSSAYYGNNENILLGSGDDVGPAVPSYTTGDIIGVGINHFNNEMFYTKNGRLVTLVRNKIKDRIYPTIAVRSQDEELTVNFGKDPFLYDLKSHETFFREFNHMVNEEEEIEDISTRIAQSYLQHYGYVDTLKEFNDTTGLSCEDSEDENFAPTERVTLRKLIMGGDIDAAIAKLREWYPQIVEDETCAICVVLNFQKTIELLRVGDEEQAITHLGNTCEKLTCLEEYNVLVKDCSALFFLEDPKSTPVGFLLDDAHRAYVADAVNAKILSTNPELKDETSCVHSYLERQVRACSLEIQQLLNGNRGEAFDLQKVLFSKTN